MNKDLKREKRDQMNVLLKKMEALLKTGDWAIVNKQGIECIECTEELVKMNDLGTQNIKLKSLIDAEHFSLLTYRGIDLRCYENFKSEEENELSFLIEDVYNRLLIDRGNEIINLPCESDLCEEDEGLVEVAKHASSKVGGNPVEP